MSGLSAERRAEVASLFRALAAVVGGHIGATYVVWADAVADGRVGSEQALFDVAYPWQVSADVADRQLWELELSSVDGPGGVR